MAAVRTEGPGCPEPGRTLTDRRLAALEERIARLELARLDEMGCMRDGLLQVVRALERTLGLTGR